MSIAGNHAAPASARKKAPSLAALALLYFQPPPRCIVGCRPLDPTFNSDAVFMKSYGKGPRTPRRSPSTTPAASSSHASLDVENDGDLTYVSGTPRTATPRHELRRRGCAHLRDAQNDIAVADSRIAADGRIWLVGYTSFGATLNLEYTTGFRAADRRRHTDATSPARPAPARLSGRHGCYYSSIIEQADHRMWPPAG